jgi:8-hydroxy-5-deazaflavin:NADPH oxidoreductase
MNVPHEAGGPAGHTGSGAQPAGQATAQAAEQAAGLMVGVLGGTGDQGRGLARRLAIAGNRVIIGSRDAGRAAAAAAGLAADPALTPLSGDPAEAAAVALAALPADPAAAVLAAAAAAPPLVTGAVNEDAAREADLVIAAVPWEGHRDTLAGLAGVLEGKILVDCVNPIGFDSRGAYPLPVPEGSAAEQAAAVLPGSRVVGAFHHVSAVLLLDPEVAELDLDVLVLGDDREATDLVQALAARIPGVRGVYAGRLRNCGQVEALTANLVSVNRRYKAHAGLRITDI